MMNTKWHSSQLHHLLAFVEIVELDFQTRNSGHQAKHWKEDFKVETKSDISQHAVLKNLCEALH